MFIFEEEVKKYYDKAIIYSGSLKSLYNSNGNKRGKSTPETRIKGVYALYLDGKLMKIGKATYKDGIFHRISQYYRMDKEGGIEQIDVNNRDKINVKYFTLDDSDELWFAERRLQVIAHDYGEKMEWENTTRN